jgi:hypothetical protein
MPKALVDLSMAVVADKHHVVRIKRYARIRNIFRANLGLVVPYQIKRI